MANKKDVKYSKDGTWRVTMDAFATNLFVYKTIGTSITVHHKEVKGGLFGLGQKNEKWVKRSASRITITNRYSGLLANLSPDVRTRTCNAEKSSHLTCNLWSVGVAITIDASAGTGLPDPNTTTPGAGASLEVRAVTGTALVYINNEVIKLSTETGDRPDSRRDELSSDSVKPTNQKATDKKRTRVSDGWKREQDATRKQQTELKLQACDNAYALDIVSCDVANTQRLNGCNSIHCTDFTNCDDIQCTDFANCDDIQCTDFTNCDDYKWYDPRRAACWAARGICVAAFALAWAACWAARGICVAAAATARAACWVARGVCVAAAATARAACIVGSAAILATCKAAAWVKKEACKVAIMIVDIAWAVGIAVAWAVGRVKEAISFGPFPIPMPSDDGWLVTLDEEKPSGLTQNNNIEVLIDAMDALEKMVQDINRAESAIHFIQLFWVPEFVATFTGERVATNATRPKDILANVLLDANRRGVVVRILLNENAITPDTYDEIRDFFTMAGENTVSVRRFPLTIQSLHAKTLTIDDKVAFIIGSPFEQGYWDTPEHSLIEPRRGTSALIGIGDRPVHDVHIRLKGPAVADVEENFRALWNFRSDADFNGADKLVPIPIRPPAEGNQSIQIVRSIPKQILPGLPRGQLGILEAYQRAIGNAKSFIYLENQYFCSRVIVDALLRAVEKDSNLQVILLINEKPDIPTYIEWQNIWLTDIIGFPHPQIGVFTLWNIGLAAGQTSLQRCYLHSKAAIIDDKWGTVGTANLDGISLEQALEFGIFGQNRRSIEINAVLFDGIANQPATGKVLAMRKLLWAEHLGRDIPLAVPTGGWLPLWQSVANANIASLNGNRSTMNGHILPYIPYNRLTTDENALNSLGIDTSRLRILT